MRAKIHTWLLGLALAATLTLTSLFAAPQAHAIFINQIPPPQPAPGAFGLEASKVQLPPTTTATISTPGNGTTVNNNSPVTISGLCTTGLLVQVYDNGVLVGAIDCTNGSFSIQVSLFPGQNDLSTIQYDDLAQPSPEGNHVTVNYNSTDFQSFGTYITLTSNYGRKAANPGQTLTWPLLLSGGTGPYAFSVDWGDGGTPSLKSQALAGEVDVTHVYSKSGIYHVTIKVTDANGVSAFMQVVAVANGKVTGAATTGSSGSAATAVSVTKILWWPAVICFILLLPAFWLGRRSMLVSMHHKLERDVENYQEY